jgi:DNA-directed RNA polymerase subunit M/transcription elongation factor TFIIS
MDPEKKRPLMIVVIVVCLLVAGLITWSRLRSGDSMAAFKGQTVWMRCDDCGAVYEIPKTEYVRWLESIQDQAKEAVVSGSLEAMECKECGANAAQEVEKCPKCGEVYQYGESGKGIPPDACPNCGWVERLDKYWGKPGESGETGDSDKSGE